MLDWECLPCEFILMVIFNWLVVDNVATNFTSFAFSQKYVFVLPESDHSRH